MPVLVRLLITACSIYHEHHPSVLLSMMEAYIGTGAPVLILRNLAFALSLPSGSEGHVPENIQSA